MAIDLYLDNDLLLACDFTAGKETAFLEVYNRFYSLIYIHSFKYTRNTPESEDIAIQAFNKLFTRHESFKSLPEIRSFLFVVARNASFNYIRDLQRRDARIKTFALHFDDAIEEDILDTLLIQELYSLIKELPSRTRQVIELIFFQDHDVKEIAEQLQISAATVWSLKSTGIKRLKRTLAEQGLITSSIVIALIEEILQK